MNQIGISKRTIIGANHVDVAKSYNALGILCNDAGDLGKAKDYHERALEIRKEQ
jgi:uncharacterized protein HemY